MYETLIRPHQIDAIPSLVPISEISERLKKAEQRREEKRLRQIANSRAVATKRKRESTAEADAEAGVTGKRPKTDDESESKASEHEQPASVAKESDPGPTQLLRLDESNTSSGVDLDPTPIDPPPTKLSVSKAFPEVRGHTSYLTFACLLPANANAGTVSSNLLGTTSDTLPVVVSRSSLFRTQMTIASWPGYKKYGINN
ncbi:hypothetical protein AcV7_009610 [Taiwanofungus camphoratus]|nr:hypothetical protein AcV7_009610 [Antrodia cinnamomea]